MKDLSNYRILIVDDTKTNLDVLVQALKNDYKLGVALNGFKAIQYANENQPDLILLDILMPGMDGFEVCKQLQQNVLTQDIPIIFISAIEDTKHITKGFDMGAVDYITKPFDIAEVKARVKTHLMLRFTRDALRNQNAMLELEVRERTRELEKTQIEILERLEKAAEYRSKRIDNHVNRMIACCSLLCKAIGMGPRECYMTAMASTMHDVGKIGIPDYILTKSEELTPEERKIMKQHPRIGAKLLSGSDKPLLQLAETIALTHHERWDGKGYPDGLAGKFIPLCGRIASICEAFDTLLIHGPHPGNVRKALEQIQSDAGTRFDPELVTQFVALEKELETILKSL